MTTLAAPETACRLLILTEASPGLAAPGAAAFNLHEPWTPLDPRDLTRWLGEDDRARARQDWHAAWPGTLPTTGVQLALYHLRAPPPCQVLVMNPAQVVPAVWAAAIMRADAVLAVNGSHPVIAPALHASIELALLAGIPKLAILVQGLDAWPSGLDDALAALRHDPLSQCVQGFVSASPAAPLTEAKGAWLAGTLAGWSDGDEQMAALDRRLWLEHGNLARWMLTLRPRTGAGVRVRPEVSNGFEALVCWRAEAPLLPGRAYRLVRGKDSCVATVVRLKHRLDAGTPTRLAASTLERDQTGVCVLELDRAITFDPGARSAARDGFVLHDVQTGQALGFGLLQLGLRRAQNIHWQAIDIDKRAHAALKGQQPCVIWLTGLSGAGKSTIANILQQRLHALGHHTCLLDGDNVRHGLNKDLGFTAADRVENIRRVGEVAKLMVEAGLIVITAFISPFREERRMVRALLDPGEFLEVFVDTPLAVAEQRDPKGLYRKARSGQLKNFTGIDSPYEAPEQPELRLETDRLSPVEAAERILVCLAEAGRLRDA